MPSANLGELETVVMDAVWTRGQATVQDVVDDLSRDRSLAYTTVMTVMSRLAEKGVLTRHKQGRAYLYEPAVERDSLAKSMLSSLVDRLYAGSAERAIAHLLETEDQVDESELQRLEALIRARREREED